MCVTIKARSGSDYAVSSHARTHARTAVSQAVTVVVSRTRARVLKGRPKRAKSEEAWETRRKREEAAGKKEPPSKEEMRGFWSVRQKPQVPQIPRHFYAHADTCINLYPHIQFVENCQSATVRVALPSCALICLKVNKSKKGLHSLIRTYTY